MHPARTLSYHDLVAGLEAARERRMVFSRFDSATGRQLWGYTNHCVYENGWDAFALLARGLILCPSEQRVVATPFPKFFNLGEHGHTAPDLPFETFEKLDGSLAIIHHHDGRWRANTRGAFGSAQGLWAEARLAAQDTAPLVPGTTYLAEAVYPENRIVIRYAEPALVMLAAYREDGTEMGFAELAETAAAMGWRMAERHSYPDFASLLADAQALPKTAEGFVLRFSNGLRLKVKGEAYRRIHALISRCTPLAMWEAIAAGDDMEAIRRDLPEEFWTDFDAITAILRGRIDDLSRRVEEAARQAAGLSDKDLGLALSTFPEDVRPFLFAWRKTGGRLEGKPRQTLLRSVRPTANVLDGYVPSYAMGHVLDDLG